MAKKYNLATIASNVTGQSALTALNSTIAQTEEALNDLADTVTTLNTKSAIIRQQVPVSGDVSVGTLVYYDVEDAIFKPALAALLPMPGSQGESVEAPSSRVEGMIISIDSANNTGTLLQGGFYTSAACANFCLGSDAVAGTYYLSPTVAGKAVTDPGNHLRQPLLTYYGDGKFSLSLFCMAHDNHFHTSEVIHSNAWYAAGVAAPAGYPYQYTPSADLGEISNDITAVFCDGVLQRTGTGKDFCIEDGVLYGKSNTAEVVLFNHFPFAYGSPVVRNVRSTDESLGVTTRNGIVTLNPSPWVVGAARKSRMALSTIGGRTINYTPVVTDVIGENGITATYNNDGSVKLSVSDRVGDLIDAYNLNFNGTTMASDDNMNTYITFPAGRTSASLAISLPLTGITSGANLVAQVWGIVQGAGATFDVTEQFTAHPSYDTTTVTDTANTSSYTLNLAGSTGALTYAATSGGVSVTANGLLTAKILLPTTPAADVKLLRVGFRLQSRPTSTTNTSAAITDISGTNLGSGTALADMPAYTCVYAVSGGLVACSCANEHTLNRCIGITLEAVTSGNTVTYVTDGVLQSPALNVSGGQVMYIGTSGELATSYDGAQYIQQVGLAVADGAIVVNIKDGTAVDVDHILG